MKEFLTESVLPLLAVCLAIAGLTGFVFDAPVALPPVIAPHAEPKVAASASRPNINDTLAQAMRILDATRAANVARPTPVVTARATTPFVPRPPATAAAVAPALALAPAALAPAEAPAADPDPEVSPAQHTLDAVSALSQAIQAARNARSDEDLVYAEQQMRLAREQMQSGCGDSAGPLCQSAQQIESLGF